MYVPKNRIKTNLYTAGNEFVVKSDKTQYTGFYHSLWTGRFFTGKTPNDDPINEIIRQANVINSIWDRTKKSRKLDTCCSCVLCSNACIGLPMQPFKGGD